MSQLDPAKARWNGDPLPVGSRVTAGQFTARLPDYTRAVVTFEVAEDGVVTYTWIKPEIE